MNRLARAASLLLLSSTAIAAPKQLKCAVLAVRAETGISPGTANLLSEIISTDVMHTDRFDVLTSADIATLIGFERQRELLGCTQGSESCFAEIGAALGTDLILETSVGTVGDTRVLAMRLIDAKNARALSRESITVKNDSALIDAAHDIVSRVLTASAVQNFEALAGGAVASTLTEHRKFHFAWGGIIGAGALAAVGVVVGSIALVDDNNFKQDPTNAALAGTSRTFAQAADGFYVSALVVAIVATVLLLVVK